MRLARWFDEIRLDVTFALRQLRRAPAFAAVAVVTLALGIGANSAIFALVDATLLRPLPFPDPHRLVMVSELNDRGQSSRVSAPNLLDWNARTRTLAEIAAFVPSVGGMVMAGADGTAETVSRQWVTAGFFSVLGVQPIVGRTFLPADDAERRRAVVMSEALWRTRFNADASIVGRDIRFDGMPFTVVGVVPAAFQLVGQTSLWGLIPIGPMPPAARGSYSLQAIGRLKPDVAIDAARADMTAVADGLAREFPATNRGRGVLLEPLHDAVIGGDLRLTSMLFLGVVGFVLLICCANVANLLLARATVRARELAIRAALGAGRRRVIRQLLTESLVLATIGGALGVGVGAAILQAAPSLVPEGLLPSAVTLTFDARVVAFCAVAATSVGVLFGLVPAWQATRLSPAQEMASTTRTVTGRGGATRGLLVGAEVATAVLLLFGAGLLLRTLLAVEGIDRGYRADAVLTMIVDPLGSKYPTAASLQQFFDQVEQEIRALPNVRDVAWSSTLPLGADDGQPLAFEIAGDPPGDELKRPVAIGQTVSATYFSALDLPVVSGRAFNDRDTREGPPVCLINEAFARQHFGGRSPIGQRLALRPASAAQAKPALREIVGVARQVKGRPDEPQDLVQLYVPMTQNLSDDVYLLVRPSTGRAGAMTPSVRAAIGRIDKEQLVSLRSVMTLEDVASEATARHRFRAVMVMTFAGLALVLAMVGVFGMLAYTVQQRMRDFALRRALGAGPGDVLRLLARSVIGVIAVGGVIGLGLAAMLGQLLQTVLFGVAPLDPTTFAGVVAVLGLTSVIAIAAPAWRAMRIDPAIALRGD